MTAISHAQNNFIKISRTYFSADTIKTFADSIRARVKNGEVSWDELGFTNKDVTERLRNARVREAA